MWEGVASVLRRRLMSADAGRHRKQTPPAVFPIVHYVNAEVADVATGTDKVRNRERIRRPKNLIYQPSIFSKIHGRRPLCSANEKKPKHSARASLRSPVLTQLSGNSSVRSPTTDCTSNKPVPVQPLAWAVPNGHPSRQCERNCSRVHRKHAVLMLRGAVFALIQVKSETQKLV